jgi:flagella basal body P-ring formation protein FlgA
MKTFMKWYKVPPLAMGLFLSVVLLAGLVGESLAGEVSEGSLRDALDAYLQEHAPPGVELEQWELRRGDVLPVQGRIVEVALASGARWQKKTPFQIRVEKNSGQLQTLRLQATLRRARTVVVARRNLPMGHRISHEDLATEVQEGWRNHKDLYDEIGQVVGKRIWRPVSKGACLKSWHVRDRRDIQRGDTVVIVAQAGSVRVQAPGQLLESGNPGDRVRVLNVASGKEIYGTIVDAHTVSVSY